MENRMIVVDDLTMLQESYDELKAQNLNLAEDLKRAHRAIDRLKDELSGKEKLLRMMTSAARREEDARKKAKLRHEHETEALQDMMKVRMLSTGFLSFSAGLIAFTLIYLIVRAARTGWI